MPHKKQLADGTEITEETLGEVAWYSRNTLLATHPVGQKKPNAFGLYDMHGNVCEWTSTADDGDRVVCGGGVDDNERECKAGYRISGSLLIGFRLAADKAKQ